MQRLRTVRGFVHALVAVFFLGQFAGVASSPLVSVEAFGTAVTLHADHGHAHHHHADGAAHHQGSQDADRCCALHAFFTGILPPAIAVEIGEADSQELTPRYVDIGVGGDFSRLDRPPRPLHLI